jgi:multicomponent Na+:H+ antiporter subunit B
MTISAFGLFIAAIAGLMSIFFAVPFMTGLWVYPVILGVEIPLSSVMLFDTGVYLVVVGAITSIALALEAEEDA